MQRLHKLSFLFVIICIGGLGLPAHAHPGLVGSPLVVGDTSSRVPGMGFSGGFGFQGLLDEYSPPDQGMNLVLILDSSGSMTESDPNDLRVDAARMVIDRLPSGTTASVVDFDGAAKTLASTPNVSVQRQRLKQAVERIDANGGTHIGNALKEGARALRSGSQQRKVALLLTDGKGEYNGEIEPYQANGWCLYPVALGSNPNLQLLRSLADSTCGEYMKATDAIEVSRDFGQIVSEIQDAPLLTTHQGRLKSGETDIYSVHIDNTINDLHCQLTWPESSLDIRILDPQGQPLETSNVRGATYVIARVQDVETGEYRVEIQAQGGSGGPYWLQVSGTSSLRPRVEQFPTTVLPGYSVPIRVIMSGAEVRPQSIRTEAERRSQTQNGNDRSLSLQLQRGGGTISLAGRIPPADTRGDYRVIIRIFGETLSGASFERIVDRTYTVTPDAEMTRPTIARVLGTHLVLRGARTFGLRPGLTIYVETPGGRRAGEGIITSIEGNEATVDLEAVMGALEITSQYSISFDPIQWRADRQ